MPNELKPCPFCGGEAYLDRHDIFCDCGAKIDIPLYVGGKVSIAGYPTYEEAKQQMIDAWNRRAGAEAEIAKLVAENERILRRARFYEYISSEESKR